MFIPDEGEIFLSIDSSQAEARVVAKLADDEETLEIYDKHDAHALTASWFFGGNESDYSKKVLGYESPYRFAGKTLRHAGNLGAGSTSAIGNCFSKITHCPFLDNRFRGRTYCQRL